MDVPYYQLEEEGHVFSEMPTLEDFEAQLAYSINLISNFEGNVIFDRCPADMLAYLITHNDSASFDVDTWLPEIQNALAKLDLLIFVPVEEPDQIECPEWENLELRSRVDEELRDMTLGDSWGFQLQGVEVNGSVSERIDGVLEHIQFLDMDLSHGR
jgi:hypothetical protein